MSSNFKIGSMHDCVTKKFKLKYKIYFFGKFILMFILPFIAFNG